MDTQTQQKLKEILDTHEKVAIVVGKNPNLDEMGAALALYLSLQQTGKQVSITSPTEPIVEVSSLVGIDKVKTHLDSGSEGDLVVAFPYQEGEIEKVSYTLENGYLNIIVKAGELGLSFSEKDVTYRRKGGAPQLIIAVGVPRISDLGPLFNINELKDTTIVNIDNKEENQGFGEVVLVSSRFSSVSEEIAQVLNSLNLPLDVDSAQNLLSGIAYATENFQSQNTSYLAFELAATLMKKGASRPKAVQQKQAVSQPTAPEENFMQQWAQAPAHDSNRDRLDEQPRMPQMPQQRPNRPQPRAGFPRQQFQQPQQGNNDRQQPRHQGFQQPMAQQRPQPAPINNSPINGQTMQNMQPMPQSRPQPMAQPMQRPAAQAPQNNDQQQPDAPADWLTPKVYKGSSLI